MRKPYAPGQMSRAIRVECGKLVTTAFGYHDLPFSDGKGLAPNVLAALLPGLLGLLDLAYMASRCGCRECAWRAGSYRRMAGGLAPRAMWLLPDRGPGLAPVMGPPHRGRFHLVVKSADRVGVNGPDRVTMQ